jgi:hypothetical protein
MRTLLIFILFHTMTAKADLDPKKVSSVVARSARNELVLVNGKPLLWGDHGGDFDSSQPQYYENVLSDLATGKVVADWKLPVYGTLGTFAESHFDLVSTGAGKSYGILRLTEGSDVQPIWRLEVYDFLTGNPVKTTQLKAADNGCAADKGHTAGGTQPFYLRLPSGIFFTEICPAASGNDLTLVLVNVLNSTITKKRQHFDRPSDCAIAKYDTPLEEADVVLVCWPQDWQAAGGLITATEALTGKTRWSFSLGSGVDSGYVYLTGIWTLPSGDSAVVFETSNSGNASYLIPAGINKNLLMITGLPTGSYVIHLKETGMRNGMPYSLGYAQDESGSGDRTFTPFSLDLTSGQVSPLSYVPWRAFSFVPGELYTVAPAKDQKSFSIVNTLTGNTEDSIATPYSQDYLWNEYEAGRDPGSFGSGEAHDGVVQGLDKVWLWADDPVSSNDKVSETTIVELPHKVQPPR